MVREFRINGESQLYIDNIPKGAIRHWRHTENMLLLQHIMALPEGQIVYYSYSTPVLFALDEIVTFRSEDGHLPNFRCRPESVFVIGTKEVILTPISRINADWVSLPSKEELLEYLKRSL